MKLKLKYPVTQVAAAVGRPKNVVYRALSINLKKPMLKRGRHKLLSKKEQEGLFAFWELYENYKPNSQFLANFL